MGYWMKLLILRRDSRLKWCTHVNKTNRSRRRKLGACLSHDFQQPSAPPPSVTVLGVLGVLVQQRRPWLPSWSSSPTREPRQEVISLPQSERSQFLHLLCSSRRDPSGPVATTAAVAVQIWRLLSFSLVTSTHTRPHLHPQHRRMKHTHTYTHTHTHTQSRLWGLLSVIFCLLDDIKMCCKPAFIVFLLSSGDGRRPSCSQMKKCLWATSVQTFGSGGKRGRCVWVVFSKRQTPEK